MSNLMVRYDPSLLLAHNPVLLFLAHQDYFYSLEQICLGNCLPSILNGIDCRLIDHIGQIRAYRAGSCQRNGFQINRLVHPHIFGMNL